MTFANFYLSEQHTMDCPYCGSTCKAGFIDNGIGLRQNAPYRCEKCKSWEMSPYELIDVDKLTEMERKTGWYEPRLVNEEGEVK